jgi:putative transposase
MYNASLYIIKQEFIKTGKWIRTRDLDKNYKQVLENDYRALPAAASQIITQQLDNNLKSYFQAIKVWKRDNKKFTGCPIFPKYKHKEKGRNVLTLSINNAVHKGNFIWFSKQLNIPNLTTNTNSLQQVRIVPQSSCIVIEVVYRKEPIVKEHINRQHLAIDLGVNNLATCTTMKKLQPFIINGRPLKSINQYYNKRLSELKSQAEKNHGVKTTNRIKKLTLKRNNKVNDYMHKASKHIVDYCKENKIDNIIIGNNDGWKQEINIGKRNNQNFVQIPFENLIQKITYKQELEGGTCKTREESYTSKCSALDREDIKKHATYLGKRVKRGLFKTSTGLKINSDVNGSLNILRKQVSCDPVILAACRGFVANPLKINLHK